MKVVFSAFLVGCTIALPVVAEQKTVYLQDIEGMRLEIATLKLENDLSYSVVMSEDAFADHFLSMRPFKCLEGPDKHWCHVPYPYTNARNIKQEFTDLEYDFLFLWKGATEYGINMWNGVYYKLEETDGRFTGTLHEMDMNILASPPEDGDLRPVSPSDLHVSDPESHWLPTLIVE